MLTRLFPAPTRFYAPTRPRSSLAEAVSAALVVLGVLGLLIVGLGG